MKSYIKYVPILALLCIPLAIWVMQEDDGKDYELGGGTGLTLTKEEEIEEEVALKDPKKEQEFFKKLEQKDIEKSLKLADPQKRAIKKAIIKSKPFNLKEHISKIDAEDIPKNMTLEGAVTLLLDWTTLPEIREIKNLSQKS